MTKWTSTDIPDQTGRTAVITGANTGLGYETASALASHGARVILAVRHLDKGKAAADLIARRSPGADVAVQELDLTSLASVRAAAEELRANQDRIDLLINNAGVMMTPEETTKDGFELQFGTNHLGHFALTGLLIDRLLDTPGSRVVTVSSMGHRLFARAGIRFDDLQWERGYSRTGAYGQAKLANLMFTYELQRRLAPRPVTVNAVCPGFVPATAAASTSGVMRLVMSFVMPHMPFATSVDAATDSFVFMAVDPSLEGVGGKFFGEQHPIESSPQSRDTEQSQRFWELAERLTAAPDAP